MTAVSVNHVQYWDTINGDVKALLIDKFQSQENIVKLIYVISSHKEKIDQAYILMALGRIIANATGDYLDEIGSRLGVDRESSTDDQYRAILQIRAYRVQGQGTRSDIISILSRFTGISETDIDTYVGKNKSFDIAFYEECLNTNAALSELEKLFPVVSSYRLIAKGGKAFMFGSVYDDSDYSEDGSNGCGSVYDTEVSDYASTYGGRLGSLLYATS